MNDYDRLTATEESIRENPAPADRRPLVAVTAETIHTEIDRLEKSLHVLAAKIGPALQPEIPTESAEKEGSLGEPRSEVMTHLNGIGRHVASVRQWVDELAERVDL